MPAPLTPPATPPTDRPRTLRGHAGRVARQSAALAAGVVAGIACASAVRDLGLLWMVLLPLGLWALANRGGVRAAAGGFDLRSVPAADLVAMTLGVVLAVPAAHAALDGSWPRAASLVTMLALVGFGVLGHAEAIRAGAVAPAHGPFAHALDVALRGLRTTSGLTNVYLAAVGTLLAFPAAAQWLPTVAMVATGALHAVLEGREHGEDAPTGG